MLLLLGKMKYSLTSALNTWTHSLSVKFVQIIKLYSHLYYLDLALLKIILNHAFQKYRQFVRIGCFS